MLVVGILTVLGSSTVWAEQAKAVKSRFATA
jgi:hypothetical protein